MAVVRLGFWVGSQGANWEEALSPANGADGSARSHHGNSPAVTIRPLGPASLKAMPSTGGSLESLDF